MFCDWSDEINLEQLLTNTVNSDEFDWKYLSNTNLLKNYNDTNLSNIDQVKFLEKATTEGIFEEKDLLNLYLSFQFDINQLINIQLVLNWIIQVTELIIKVSLNTR